MSEKTIPVALTIAGSDSGGGAGVQADLKTFGALGVHGTTAITALTAQNTRGVAAIHDLPPPFVRSQIDAIFEDFDVGATKLGMLSSAQVVEVVAECLARHRARSIVLDPVIVSKSGHALLQADAVGALKERILPLAAIVTPNLPEAAVLLGRSEGEVALAPESACQALIALGARAVVLKGGHAGGAFSEDLFFDGSNWMRLPARRVFTQNTHGTGCTFSAAIAAGLARGMELPAAVAQAKTYVTEALLAAVGWKLGHGHGHGPVHHFYATWRE